MFSRLGLTLIAGTSILVQAEDWPQFRCPTGQGHATERGLPLEWSESKNIVWKTPVPGLGWSSPAVASHLPLGSTAQARTRPE